MRLDLALTRAPTQAALDETMNSVPPHWPFFGCCNMVAAFGYVVAVAASGPEHSALPSYQDEIRLRGGMLSSQGVEEASVESIVANWMQSPSADWSGIGTGAGSGDWFGVAAGPQFELARQQQQQQEQEAVVWKLRSALSNMGFAESTLARYASVWPIADKYREEVRLCRKAIDFSGPTGMGQPF